MANPPMDVTRLAGRDTAQAARLLSDVRAARLTGQRPRLAPRPVIDQSWDRMLRSGVDPDHGVRTGLLTREELERRRETSRLRHVLPVLRQGLLSVADATQHIMLVADEDGRVLWREGSTPVLRRADRFGIEPGADWAEEVVGTNGVGTPAVARRPVQVFASEHFVRSLATWTCTGAPITDPRDGRLIGVVDVSGPLETMHPATLAWVDSVAKLAEARLRERHHHSLERLRASAAPVLARLGGRALAVDRDGWTAAVTGLPYTNRVALPKSLSPGRRWLPALGLCAVEPLAGGWLIRVAAELEPRGATRIVLDLGRARRWSVAVSGPAGSWTHELSPRHAELLYLLALHPAAAARRAWPTTCSVTRVARSRCARRCRGYGDISGRFSTTARTASARTRRWPSSSRTTPAICFPTRRRRPWRRGGARRPRAARIPGDERSRYWRTVTRR